MEQIRFIGSLSTLFLLLALFPVMAHAVNWPASWRNVQTLSIERAGLVRISLPIESLANARPQLEDLRLFDATGREVPCLPQRPDPPRQHLAMVHEFNVAVQSARTVLELDAGTTQAISAVTLHSPAPTFLKAIRVEGSPDRQAWKTLADGRPIFRQRNGAERLEAEFSVGVWRFLRVTVDDARSEPVPFTTAEVRVEAGPPAPVEPLALALENRVEEPGETRIQLRAGSANVTLAALTIDTPEPFFMRSVSLSHPRSVDGVVQPAVFARDTIYRTATNASASEKTTILAGTDLAGPAFWLTIRNDDNPPIRINGITATRRPIYLVFHAAEAGNFFLLTGNAQCAAPRYELASMRASLPEAVPVEARVGALEKNPNYQPTDPLAAIPAEGAPLDVSAWAFRKRVLIEEHGWQQLDLDLDVLAGADTAQTDLRLIREERQVPYLLERGSIERRLMVVFRPADDPKRPQVSRWRLQLPRASVPIERLIVSSSTAYFDRSVRLFEERSDSRGANYTVTLGSAGWVRRNEPTVSPLVMPVYLKPAGQLLYLEIENGDNAPLVLDRVEASYRPVRLLFKSLPGSELYLYYGLPGAPTPRYDLAAATAQVLGAKRIEAKLGAEEVLKSRLRRFFGGASAGWAFWLALSAVVVGLLVIIAKLLPKKTE